MNYMILDLEVDAKKVRKRFCDPLELDHKIVMMQKKEPGKDAKLLYRPEGLGRNHRLKLDCDVLVGHNIKFDLLYLWKNEDLQNYLKRGGLIWDTCLAEFMLSGQNKHNAYDLGSCSVRYGGTQKIDVVKQHLNSGKYFSELDSDIALEYGAKDVIDTERVYLNQVHRAEALGMSEILKVHMQHLVALCEIEANGLHLDVSACGTMQLEQETAIAKLTGQIKNTVSRTGWPTDLVEFNPASPAHVSVMLFGGSIKYKDRVPTPNASGATHYKSGARKGEVITKIVEREVVIRGLGLKKTDKTSKEGIYKTGDKDLSRLKHPFVDLILLYRKECKLLSTYIEGYTPLINPYTGSVHSEFKTIATATGRLASRNPNVQNIHPKFLKCFSSRFDGGKIVEIDFSQLEVCIAAYIFNDSLLLTEITNNVDLHLQNAKALYRKDTISPAERKIAKFLTFGLLYGQGARMMSAVHGISEDLASRFINVFYDKYMDIAEAHRQLPDEIDRNAVGDVSFISTPTGRRYFLEKYEKARGKFFSPTESKNYKIQGTASDIVACAVGNVFQYLQLHRDRVIMVNEVHDSLILDCASGSVDAIITKVTEIMEGASKYLSEVLGKEILVPLTVDVSTGNTWADCKK